VPLRAVASVGALNQWVSWQQDAVPVWPVAFLSVTAGLAMATNPAAAHAFLTGDELEVAGATDAALNGRVVVTVVDAHSLTWPAAGPDTVGTGQVTLAYVGDGLGGRRVAWTQRALLAAEVSSLGGSGNETIQADAVHADVVYRVRIWKVDLTPADRLVWEGIVLQIVGIFRQGDDPFLVLNCVEGSPDAG
jgi:head-tail adaptor